MDQMVPHMKAFKVSSSERKLFLFLLLLLLVLLFCCCCCCFWFVLFDVLDITVSSTVRKHVRSSPVSCVSVRTGRARSVCVFQWVGVPFAMTHDASRSITENTEWLGAVEKPNIGSFIDFYLLLIFGGIPWQVS